MHFHIQWKQIIEMIKKNENRLKMILFSSRVEIAWRRERVRVRQRASNCDEKIERKRDVMFLFRLTFVLFSNCCCCYFSSRRFLGWISYKPHVMTYTILYSIHILSVAFTKVAVPCQMAVCTCVCMHSHHSRHSQSKLIYSHCIQFNLLMDGLFNRVFF